jgi:hypothetical protein
MQSDALFPLTPTLSRRERERSSTALEYSLNSEDLLALPMVLPLPKGEGWGEGEGRFLMRGSGLDHLDNVSWQNASAPAHPGNPSGHF